MRKWFGLLLAGFIILAVGCVYFIFEAKKFNALDQTPPEFGEVTEKVYAYKINKRNFVINNKDAEVIIDNELQNNIVIKVYYPAEFADLEVENIERGKKVSLKYLNVPKTDFRIYKNFIGSFMRDLQNNNIYNYKKLYNPTVKVYVNEKNEGYIILNNKNKD